MPAHQPEQSEMARGCILLVVILLAATARSATITIESLLNEMTDRDALARFPDPTYTTGQASSYDRASKEPGTPEWFANNDWSQFVRPEKHGDRTEWVMMDAAGPGCVTRIWSGGPKPKGVIRFYLDESEKPAIEMLAAELIGGTGLVGPPLSQVTARGLNLYLPIPYAKHCKITYDGPNFWQTHREPDQIWYNIEYRTYPLGTRVETFTRVPADAVARAAGPLFEDAKVASDTLWTLRPGGAYVAHYRGPAAVRELSINLKADDLPAALRSCVLLITCDGEQTVWCPVGEFFGSGVGLNLMQTRQRSVEKDGAMRCRWVMPFEKSCEIELRNLGGRSVTADLGVTTGKWNWDDRSMHFHATWHNQYPIQTKQAAGTMDWNYVTIQGKGVYVGDALTVFNTVPDWWGEGDEKIHVDGEKFPSHFGTGTEDFYGYAYGDTHLFSHPFHAQTRCDGPGNKGFTCITRERSLDAIPFKESFKLDLEIWHWKATQVMYSATSYWYALPGARSEPGPAPDDASKPLPALPTSR
jgi:hypothetical protein